MAADAKNVTPKAHGKKRRPFGISIVEKASPAYLFALIVAMYSFGTFISQPLHHLRGTEVRIAVTSVIDGDTFIASVQPQGMAIKFRLKRVDAPELDQTGGPQARAALAELLQAADHEVIALIDDQDHWGRYVVDVVVRDALSTKSTYVQQALVDQGWAWALATFARAGSLKIGMDGAKAAKRGLWALSEAPVEPWKHRWVKGEGAGPRPTSEPRRPAPGGQRRPGARPGKPGPRA